MIYAMRTTHEVLIAVPADVWRAQQRSREAAHDYKTQLALARGTEHTVCFQTMFDDARNVYVEVVKFDAIHAAQMYIHKASMYIDGLIEMQKETINA